MERARKNGRFVKASEADTEVLERSPKSHRYVNYSVDRLAEIIHGANRWCVREADKALVEDMPDWEGGYATFPIHPDIKTVSDLIRIGAPALSLRFREIDPLVWSTLIEALQDA